MSQLSLLQTQYSVSELTNLLKSTLKEDPVLGGKLLVQGELSNVKRSSRGHVYATLKEEGAAISLVLWASQARKLTFELEEGLAVLATATLDIYAPNGTYSLVASKLEPVGLGDLQLAFRQLKERLSAEGLFDEVRKQALPAFPLRIGLVTSPTGAVLHDMLRVIRRKNPVVDVVLAPAKVQGEGAAVSIAQAIEALDAQNVDCMIVARGGGSFEDLFCFSEEPVVRAIAYATTPIVSGVGHEPDYSLADAAADVRASTPTAAAEVAVPDVAELSAQLQGVQHLLESSLKNQLLLHEQQLDQLSEALKAAGPAYLQGAQAQLERLAVQLQERSQAQLERRQEQLGSLAAELDALSPLKVLGRGYALVLDKAGLPQRSASALQAGQTLTLTFHDGQRQAKVEA